jgi:hypothetical protein
VDLIARILWITVDFHRLFYRKWLKSLICKGIIKKISTFYTQKVDKYLYCVNVEKNVDESLKICIDGKKLFLYNICDVYPRSEVASGLGIIGAH